MDEDIEVVLARFEPVLPSEEQAQRVLAVRAATRLYVKCLHGLIPPGRYASLALTAVEEAAMWAVKAVTHG